MVCGTYEAATFLLSPPALTNQLGRGSLVR